MIKLFQKTETDKYIIIKILFIKITFKKKIPKSDIDVIVWWIPFKSLRNAVRNIYYKINDKFSLLNDINKNIIDFHGYIECLELARKYHKDTFGPYKELYTNKDIVIIANGPSANNYVRINKAIKIGVNRAFYIKNIDLDYLFIQDFRDKDMIKKANMYNKNKCAKFYGYVDRKFHSYIDVTISNDDFKFSSSKMYIINCQWFIYDCLVYDISSFPLGDFSSVIFSAIQFAFWTNPKRIYLVGCDATNDGHFYNGKSYLNIDKLILGWNRVKEFQKTFYPNTEIISINPVGLKGMFKDIYTEDGNYYVDENGNKINI